MEQKKTLLADAMCIPVQKMVFDKLSPGVEVNDFAPRTPPGEHIREDGVRYVNDLCYGTKYPNSHLDIWYPDADRSKKRPTIIYMHGGACIFGDKVVGDPLAAGNGRDVDFCAEVAKRGYHVVSMNYALAPEYRFPVQVEQVDQMLLYLTQHQTELGLDMERVFLGGGSAGANLAEIYATVLTNPLYAEKLGVYPSIRPQQIKGLLIDEAALSPAHFDHRMKAMMGCWLGTDELAGSELANLLDVSRWIVRCYIPAFINSSNQEIWFEDSAKALAAALDQTSTDYEYFYRGPECEVLNHGYMQLFASNPYARECLEHMLDFIKRHL